MKFVLSFLLITGLVRGTAVAQPVITNMLPASGTAFLSHTTINFSCIVSGPHSISNVVFSLPLTYDYGDLNQIYLWQASAIRSGSSWSASWVNPNIPSGSFMAIATATDSLGNVNADTVIFRVISDQWNMNQGTNTTYDTVDNVAIGTNNPYTYKLAVNGPAIATKVVAKPYASWPDYVFDKGYRLPSINKVAQFVKAHQHLPDLPNADSIAKGNIDVGNIQTALYKKLEEMTLYMIAQNIRLKEQHRIFKLQEERIRQLERSIVKKSQ